MNVYNFVIVMHAGKCTILIQNKQLNQSQPCAIMNIIQMINFFAWYVQLDKYTEQVAAVARLAAEVNGINASTNIVGWDVQVGVLYDHALLQI